MISGLDWSPLPFEGANSAIGMRSPAIVAYALRAGQKERVLWKPIGELFNVTFVAC